MNKVQLTLSMEEAEILNAQAAQFGYKLTKYIKLLISQKTAEILESDKIPTFRMSNRAYKIAKEAKEEHKKGQTIELSSIDMLDNL